MRIDYKTIPTFLELDKKEVKRKLIAAQKEYENFEQDLFFENELTVIMEFNYHTTKWQFKEYYVKGYKMAL